MAIYDISNHKHSGTVLIGLAVCVESMQLAEEFDGVRKSKCDADGYAVILVTCWNRPVDQTEAHP